MTTLYLKYRPKNLDELDLKDVGESLKSIVNSGKIPHAFLFSGPKGTGKTSAARILAKILNCEKLGKNGTPCDKCEQCISITQGNNLDVVEMDAASHRGIDDVRTLRDAVKLAPVTAKKKIYIIDEAHMLTTEASNALLKTLEEPPEHVVFILATTNPEKLIDTIRSRVTNIPFRKATTGEIVKSLERVIAGEKIKADTDALEIIAEAGGGAFRDAIKILEQLVSEEKELSKEFLEEYLLSKKAFDLDNFVASLVKKDEKVLIEEVGKLSSKGVSVESFLEALLKKLRNALLAKTGVGTEDVKEISKTDLIFLLELLSNAASGISDSPIEELPLELAIVRWCETGRVGEELKIEDEENDEKASEPVSSISNSPKPIHADAIIPEAFPAGEVNDEAWRMILSQVKPINASIEALLRAARPIGYDGKVLTLGVFYKFHKERLEDVQHRRVLESIVGEVLKSPTKVVCALVEPPVKKLVEETKTETVLTESKDKDIIKAAEEIFGN